MSRLDHRVSEVCARTRELKDGVDLIGPSYDRGSYENLRWAILDLQAIQERWERRWLESEAEAKAG